MAQLSEAFAVELGHYQAGETNYRGREGHVHLPGRPGADRRGRVRAGQPAASQAAVPARRRPAQAVTALTPPQVAKLYDFPTGASAAGQCIGLLEFGGGYHPADITAWFSNLGLTPPPLADVGVDGATNSPGSDADTEVILDIDVAGSVAPGARSPSTSPPGPSRAGSTSSPPRFTMPPTDPSVLSISWGWPELGARRADLDRGRHGRGERRPSPRRPSSA